MLQHEQEQSSETPAAQTPAAQIRVTSEELAQAINALEASRDEAARHLAGTVPIGEVVKELKLEATPEEIWAQVQRQRARKAADEAAAQAAAIQKEQANATQKEQANAAQAVAAAQAAAAQAVAAARSAAQSAQAGAQVYARPKRRGRWWAPLGIGLLIYAGVHGSQVRIHTPANTPGVITGYNRTLTWSTQGKNVEVVGGKGTLTLRGDCPTLTVTGDDNHIRVVGTVGRVIATGDNNSVVYTQGNEPTLIGTGVGNHVAPSKP